MTQVLSSTDLTAQWLTDTLRSSGALAEDTSVASFTTAPFQDAESMMSSLQRVSITYDGPTDAPTSLIAKFASANPEMAFVASLFRFYEREVRYYAELDHKVEISTPRCLHAEMYPDDAGFVILLEEVTGLRSVDQLDGLSLTEARICMETLADLHAPMWGADLSAFAETMLAFDSPAVIGVLPDKSAADWQAARPHVADILDAEALALCDRFAEILPNVVADMGEPDTLTHGDFRADNLLFDGDAMLVLDFQLMATGHGMTDVAYCISQSMTTEVAATGADELIDAYLARLASHRIDADRDDAMRAYRAGCVFYMSIPISLLATEGLHDRAAELGRAALARATAEAVRCGAAQVYA